MKLNKNVIAASTLTLLLALPLITMAVPLSDQPIIPTGLTLQGIPSGATALERAGIVNAILTVVWWVFMGLVVIFFIIIAVLFLSSQGNPEAAATAKRALVWGGAGVIIGVLGFGIIKILTNTLGIT